MFTNPSKFDTLVIRYRLSATPHDESEYTTTLNKSQPIELINEFYQLATTYSADLSWDGANIVVARFANRETLALTFRFAYKTGKTKQALWLYEVLVSTLQRANEEYERANTVRTSTS